ncbi:hypothetical protein KGQ27_02730 [Patescibacteria group bacterium]|nr:hypothetical protein [Patescibacteria group bacterium]MDE1946783.1 hypothetical protein [Patescibacteria group bacterium]MDE2011085.1 hypothetical protein [Patescibacteria group bacterium]MDE2233142.1 hypothetical protein [Patescibacteria group bacterium]
MTAKDYFKGKRIALIGLGSYGEEVEDAKFMIRAGAILSIYDLRSEARLKSHLVFLRSVGLANYVCGSIPAEDLPDMDLIILSREYSRSSSFLEKATEKGVMIEYPETLFFKLAPPITVVGVMGACGKTTVISMLAPMLSESCGGLYISDGASGGLLLFLKKIRNGDILIMRIDSVIAAELKGLNISPQVAVLTGVPPKGVYSDSPFDVLANQTYNNFIVASDEVIDATRVYGFKPRAKMLRTKTSVIPESWLFNGRTHDRENAALALQTAKLFKVSEDTAQKVLEVWKPLKGRVELVKKVKMVEFYNDAASAVPEATMAGIISLAQNRNIVLILGGAHSGHDYRALNALIPQYAHTVVLLPGSGTILERKELERLDNVDVLSAPSVEEAVRLAQDHARSGDRVLFSPGFDAAGIDSSCKERGERFVRAVRAL